MCVERLCDGLGILGRAEESEAVAACCESSGDVWLDPALRGLVTPVWDFRARGMIVGLTRGTGQPEIVRAVLEGVAHRGADLLEAAEADSGDRIESLRVDGGISAHEAFVTALAEAIGRPVAVSPVVEAPTLGAGLLAGLAVGTYRSTYELAQTFTPRRTCTRCAAREHWLAGRPSPSGDPGVLRVSF